MSLFDPPGETWRPGSLAEANYLLAPNHYLGPLGTGGFELVFVHSIDGQAVACQIWRHPTSRHLPQDGTWWELSRWCLTPTAGPYAGSRMHRHATKWIKANHPEVTTLVSYSDPSVGHTGALYRACNWYWAPTWLRLRPPPSGNGNWGTGVQAVKDRWAFNVRPDNRRTELLAVNDAAAARLMATS